MTEKTYVCNVCRTKFPLGNAEGRIVGFSFQGGSGATGGNSTSWQSASLHQTDNHICIRCLDNAANFKSTTVGIAR